MSKTEKLLPEGGENEIRISAASSQQSSRFSYASGPGLSIGRMTSLNNAAINPNAGNTKKSIKHDSGDYYWAKFESKWTLLDQKRLVSMDYLIHRSLEFHNNHHTFRASGNFDYSGELGDPQMSDFALEVQMFHPHDTTPPPSQLLHFGEIDKGYLSRFPLDSPSPSSSSPSASTSSARKGNIYWFNVKDIRSLRSVADHLRMETLALALFYDLRSHSTISALENGLFMSFCIVTLNGNDAELHKVSGEDMM